MKRLRTFLLVLVIVAISNSYSRSLIVMTASNYLQHKNSFLINYEISYEIPEEPFLDWYPLMNIFTPMSFSNYIKRDVDLVIFYTFGNYSGRYSNIFRRDAKTYSSFYGMYALKVNDGKDFILDKSGNIIVEDLVSIVEYDFKYLVLNPLGYLGDVTLYYDVLSSKSINNLQVLNTSIIMNGLTHNYREFNLNYLQYGAPPRRGIIDEFEIIETYGKFIIEKTSFDNIYLIYYIINSQSEVVENWGTNLLNSAK